MRLLGSKISDIGSKVKPIKLLNCLEGYRKNGFWYYRNSNPNAGEFARVWMRVTSPSFQNELDVFSAKDESENRND